MIKYDLIIIGSGASGLSAGVSALQNGIKKVLILERESLLGGNLNLFIHQGFGESYLGKAVTGPEFASELIREFKALGGIYKIDTEVLELTKTKVVTYVNPNEGVQEIKGDVIIIASGCRERFTGNINVPIHKYTGIYTLVSAHKLVNIQGYLPGKEIVILGKNNRSLLVAVRLILEGAKIKAIIGSNYNENIDEKFKRYIKAFNINVIDNSKVIELSGDERVRSIDIESNIDNSITTLECDSLILTVGYFPDLNFIRKSNIDLSDSGDLIVNNYEISANGIFACGSVLTGRINLFNNGEEGYKTGVIASSYIKKYFY